MKKNSSSVDQAATLAKPKNQSSTSTSAQGTDEFTAEYSLVQIIDTVCKNPIEVETPDPKSLNRTLREWEEKLLFSEPADRSGIISQFVDFFTGHRKNEASYTNRYKTTLRDLLWRFVELAGVQTSQKDRFQGDVSVAVDNLKKILKSNNIEEIRKNAEDTAKFLQDSLASEKKNHEQRITELASHLQNLRSELEQTRKELEIDAMTEVYNRRAFDEQVKRVLQINRLSGKPSALLLIDLDYFKNINDTYGHLAGDEVVRVFARHLQTSFPRRTEFVARIGGDEFAVLMQEDDLGVAKKLADRLVKSTKKLKVATAGKLIDVTVSVGIAQWISGESIEDWIERADAGLYDAKRAGRDCFRDGPASSIVA